MRNQQKKRGNPYQPPENSRPEIQIFLKTALGHLPNVLGFRLPKEIRVSAGLKGNHVVVNVGMDDRSIIVQSQDKLATVRKIDFETWSKL